MIWNKHYDIVLLCFDEYLFYRAVNKNDCCFYTTAYFIFKYATLDLKQYLVKTLQSYYIFTEKLEMCLLGYMYTLKLPGFTISYVHLHLNKYT